jgi:Family of unknown function (DUF6596)
MPRLAQARRDARRDARGEYVPLVEQDPARWDAGLIEEPEALLARERALRDRPLPARGRRAVGPRGPPPHQPLRLGGDRADLRCAAGADGLARGRDQSGRRDRGAARSRCRPRGARRARRSSARRVSALLGGARRSAGAGGRRAGGRRGLRAGDRSGGRARRPPLPATAPRARCADHPTTRPCRGVDRPREPAPPRRAARRTVGPPPLAWALLQRDPVPCPV